MKMQTLSAVLRVWNVSAFSIQIYETASPRAGSFTKKEKKPPAGVAPAAAPGAALPRQPPEDLDGWDACSGPVG